MKGNEEECVAEFGDTPGERYKDNGPKTDLFEVAKYPAWAVTRRQDTRKPGGGEESRANEVQTSTNLLGST